MVRTEFNRASDMLGAVLQSEESVHNGQAVALARRIGERERALADYERQLSSLRQGIGERERTLADHERQLSSLRETIGERERTIADRERQLSSLQESTSTGRPRLAEMEHAERERDAMINSNSWRITRPLRVIVGLIRKEPAYIKHFKLHFCKARRPNRGLFCRTRRKG